MVQRSCRLLQRIWRYDWSNSDRCTLSIFGISMGLCNLRYFRTPFSRTYTIKKVYMMKNSTDKTIHLGSGRTLGYAEYGNPKGRTSFYFHGHPGSRFEAAFLADEVVKDDIHLTGVDRPGMGLSTYELTCFCSDNGYHHTCKRLRHKGSITKVFQYTCNYFVISCASMFQ